MADSYDKRAAGWNPFNLKPLQREASQTSVILHRQAAGEEAEMEVTGGGGEFSQVRERTTLLLITPISTSLTSLNNCSATGRARESVLLTGRLDIHLFKLNYVSLHVCRVVAISLIFRLNCHFVFPLRGLVFP